MNEVQTMSTGRTPDHARQHARVRAATGRAEQYLRSRQSPDGGFCFYRWGGVEEPTLADTWHAVASFALLGATVPRRDDVVNFVQRFSLAGLDDLYHAARTLSLLGAQTIPGMAARVGAAAALDACAVLTNAAVLVNGRLERALRITGLQRAGAGLNRPVDVAAAVVALRHEGGWGEKANLEDTWLALALLAICGVEPGAEGTRGFVDSLQAASLGFTATRDSSYATLDIVHAGVRSCALLGVPLRHRDDVVDFALACQSSAGGFARTPDALPNLGLTHRGLLTLVAAGAVREPAGGVGADPGY